jgi:hypothetical protein
MGVVRPVAPVKLVCGMIAGSEALLAAATVELAKAFGPIDLSGDTTPFDYTDYYAAEMGGGLLRRFVAFARPLDPAALAEVKRRTNELEAGFAVPGPNGARRRVNLDPGYVTPAKLVLATTKEAAHRIYLGGGIYAEVTLTFKGGRWVAHPWTYPDFRSGAYDAFLLAARSWIPGSGLLEGAALSAPTGNRLAQE